MKNHGDLWLLGLKEMKKWRGNESSPKTNVKMGELRMLVGYSGVGWDPHPLFAQIKMFGTPTDSLAQRCNPEIK